MFQTMIKLFIYSGLRRGELCGLEWKDVNFTDHMISVRRSSQYVPGKGIFTKETSNKVGNRWDFSSGTPSIPNQKPL